MDAVVLDIGESHTALSICSGEQRFTRTVPASGRLMTEALAKAFHVSHEEAEKRKVGASTSPQKKDIVQAMRGVWKDLLQEMQRTFQYFKSMVGAPLPAKLLLTGGGARMTGLAEFMRRHTRGCTVETMPSEKWGMGPEFSTARGLALYGTGERPVELQMSEEMAESVGLSRKGVRAVGAAREEEPSERDRIDGDKKGDVVRVWKSSYDERGRSLCHLAAQLIMENEEAARQARVNLSEIVIEDNNGIALLPRQEGS